MSFLTPLALIGALLAIPIILLYMLRLRRREVIVSSTFLWQQLLHDKEANTPWQRLRRNLLLFLQLIILALLVLALARPFVIVPAITVGQIAVLLDASASMNATDVNDGTRFDEAKRQALEIVETMNPNDTMTVIRVAGSPEVLAPYTSDRAMLSDAINSAQPSTVSADWNAALTLAAAGSVGSANFSTVIIGDGGLGDSARLPAIPGALRYIPVGRSDDNLAISALATRALPGQPPQLFAQITNYGSSEARVVFGLRVDGALLTADEYTVPAHSSVPLASSGLPDGFERVEAGLTVPVNSTYVDYLAEDNSAWAVTPNLGARRVLLMSSGNLFLEQVLRSLPSVELIEGDLNRGLPAEPYDLYIFDGWMPPALPQGDLMFVNPPISNALFAVGAESTQITNPRVQRDDPRMTYVDFSNVNLLKFRQVAASWADPLIMVDGGALLLAGETGARQVAILTFDLRDSDLPLQIQWPILMSSLMNWFSPENLINAPDGLRVGDSLAITPQADSTAVRITLPGGETRTLSYTGSLLAFADTSAPGLYTIEALGSPAITGSEVTQTAAFAVNLLDPNESTIAPQAAITLGDTVVTQAAEAEIGQREYWSLLALLGLIVLLIEWYAYHRRLHAPTVFKPLRGVRT